ncbi:MAG: hypothetical protein OXC14_11025 [Rhodospirillaceae bacterium]|nr:hypothetical protein [Rhodospirillaceae bacterium]
MFDPVYGVLHAPDRRERFTNDLSKEPPRISMTPDFHAFANAGQALTRFHLECEACNEYSLDIELKPDVEPKEGPGGETR